MRWNFDMAPSLVSCYGCNYCAQRSYEVTRSTSVPAFARDEVLSPPDHDMKIDAEDIGSMLLQPYGCDAISFTDGAEPGTCDTGILFQHPLSRHPASEIEHSICH